jgi:uncharacterized membrane protein (DUF106 family)
MLALSHAFYLRLSPEAYNEQRLLPNAALILWFFLKRIGVFLVRNVTTGVFNIVLTQRFRDCQKLQKIRMMANSLNTSRPLDLRQKVSDVCH